MHRSLWRRILAFLQSAASLAGLAVGFAALAWLAQHLENLPDLQVNPWPGGESPLVVVDAGHGGHDGGAVANGLVEKKVALALADRLRHQLEAQGIRVKMTRQADVFVTLEDRSRIANDAGAAAFVSLHLNTSVAAPEVTGLETYFVSRRGLSLRPDPAQDSASGRGLARCVQRHACRIGGVADRGIKEKPYAVVAHTACPAVLVECGFLTNPMEADRLNRGSHQDRLAEGIAAGVAEFLKTQAGQTPLAGPIVTAEVLTPAPAIAVEEP